MAGKLLCVIGSGDFTQDPLARLSPVTELGHLRPPACHTAVCGLGLLTYTAASVEPVVATPYQRVGFQIPKWHTLVQKSGKNLPPPTAPPPSDSEPNYYTTCSYILTEFFTQSLSQGTCGSYMLLHTFSGFC